MSDVISAYLISADADPTERELLALLQAAQAWYDAHCNGSIQDFVSASESLGKAWERFAVQPARINRADYANAMDEVAERIGTRVRACPHCQGEECSH